MHDPDSGLTSGASPRPRLSSLWSRAGRASGCVAGRPCAGAGSADGRRVVATQQVGVYGGVVLAATGIAAELKVHRRASTHPNVNTPGGLVTGSGDIVPSGSGSADVGANRTSVCAENADVKVNPVERVDCIGELRNDVVGHRDVETGVALTGLSDDATIEVLTNRVARDEHGV